MSWLLRSSQDMRLRIFVFHRRAVAEGRVEAVGIVNLFDKTSNRRTGVLQIAISPTIDLFELSANFGDGRLGDVSWMLFRHP